MDTLIDIQGKCVLGEIKNPRFVVRDDGWAYKLFQMENEAEFDKEKRILEKLTIDDCHHLCRMESFGYATRGEKRYRCIKMPWYGKNDFGAFLGNSSKEDLSEDDVIRLMGIILAPFLELERKGYRHNDIAPENLIRKEDGSFVLIDFGAAVRIEDIAEGRIGALEVRGHKGYNAPEKQDKRILLNSDVYSFGILLGEIVERGERLGLKYSDKLLAIGIKCRDNDSKNRFQSFLEVASALSQIKPRIEDEPQELNHTELFTKSEKRTTTFKLIIKDGLKRMVLGAAATLLFASSLTFLVMEIYLTWFRSYGDTPLEIAAKENRSIGNDFKLTFHDIMDSKNNNNEKSN